MADEVVSVPHETGMSLTEDELWKIRAYDAEFKIIQKQLYVSSVDPEGKIEAYDRDIRALLVDNAEAKRKAEEVRKAASERLGIDIANYSYDDQTGLLYPQK